MIFSAIDAFYAAFILVLALSGSIKGFVRSLFAILSIALSIFSAFFFAKFLTGVFKKLIENPTVDFLLSFFTVFVATFLVIKILENLVSRFFSGEILKSLDRLLGFIFGALKGFVFLAAFFVIVKSQTWIDLKILWEKSLFFSILSKPLEVPIKIVSGILV